MGTLISKPKKRKLLLVGSYSVGKTSLLYKLKYPHEEITSTFPSIGFNVETIDTNVFELTAWDTGGRDKIRALERLYYPGTDAIIFVVDSTDRDRLEIARDEFERTLGEEDLDGVPVLLFCNKQDLPNAMDPKEIACQFGVERYRKRATVARRFRHTVIVQGCSAKTGCGTWEGLDMLTRTLLYEENECNKNIPLKEKEKNKLATLPQTTKMSPDPHFSSFSKSNLTLQRFSTIKRSTECPFAKAAKLWGGPPIPSHNSKRHQYVEVAQAEACVESLIEFTNRSNRGEKLDGFCIEIDCDEARNVSTPAEFGECVRRLLTAIADLDPSDEEGTTTNIMRVNYVGDRGWRFRFLQTDFFVTTFAPCYPKTSSRYNFGSDRAFVLLQPELSFLRHDLPPDTGHTHWSNPKTIRDKTRIAFRNAGRAYYIPQTTKYPMAEHIVKPLKDDGTSVVRWWMEKGAENVRAK